MSLIMLVNAGEDVMIGVDIRIQVISKTGRQAKLKISAPQDLIITKITAVPPVQKPRITGHIVELP